MFAVLRTIVIVDLAANAAVFGLGALFGLSPRQSVGAALIALVTLGTVMAWRAIANAPSHRPRQEWTHPGCDPVDRLPVERVTAELVEPPGRRVRVQPQAQIEAPRRELEVQCGRNE